MSVMLRLVCCFVYVSKVRKKTGELTYCLLTVLKPKCKKKNIYFCQADSFHTDSFSFADIGCNLAQLLLRFNVSVRTYMQFIHYMHIYMYINLWVFLLIFFFSEVVLLLDGVVIPYSEVFVWNWTLGLNWTVFAPAKISIIKNGVAVGNVQQGDTYLGVIFI